MQKVKKGKVNGKLVDVISLETYSAHPDLYDPAFTAIEDDGILYPIIKHNPMETNEVGCYDKGGYFIFNDPSKENIDEYKATKDNIVDFSDTKNIEELIQQTTNYKEMEKEMLTDTNGICQFDNIENDEANMRALKKAINLKKINIDNYKKRGDQFINDKRLLKKDSITLKKELGWFDILDIKATLILEDKNPDVPNPMGKKVIVELNSDGEDKII